MAQAYLHNLLVK